MARGATKFQSEIDHTDSELAAIGARFSADRLIGGAPDVLGLASEDDAKLRPFGFGAPWRARMAARVAELRAAHDARVATQSDARPSGQKADASLAALEQWLVRYHTVIALSGPKVADGAPHAVGVRVAAIAERARQCAGYVGRKAQATAPHGGGAAFAREGRALADAFVRDHGTHEAATAKVPPEVRALHAAEGVVAAELSRLSVAAHAALPPERARLYAMSRFRPSNQSRSRARPAPAPAGGTP